MEPEMETVEQRLKSFMGQLQTEYGILDRLVYKHKNQHRRSSHFQYILKVRRDMKLLKLAKLEEIVEAAFLVINGNRPKQKLQLLESLKRGCDSDKYNFLERLLGVTRLLSQMVEPMLKASMQISTLLAQSFFMKFSLTTLAVLARMRVLVQQILLDAVYVYNAVSALSQKEQTVKLNQEGFEVFREYYPKKEEAIVLLDCIWQTDKYVLAERINQVENDNVEKEDLKDISEMRSDIKYENIEVVLGIDEIANVEIEHLTTDPLDAEQNRSNLGVQIDQNHVEDGSDLALASDLSIVAKKEVLTEQLQVVMTGTNNKRSISDLSSIDPLDRPPQEDGLPSTSDTSPFPDRMREVKKRKVAFISVKPPTPSNPDTLRAQMEQVEKSSREKGQFFSLLMEKNEDVFL